MFLLAFRPGQSSCEFSVEAQCGHQAGCKYRSIPVSYLDASTCCSYVAKVLGCAAHRPTRVNYRRKFLSFAHSKGVRLRPGTLQVASKEAHKAPSLIPPTLLRLPSKLEQPNNPRTGEEEVGQRGARARQRNNVPVNEANFRPFHHSFGLPPSSPSPFSSLSPPLPHMPSQPARKRRNARRTCTNCRVCKTRCELPDLSVPDSSAALPRHLKCHRCRALDVECVVNDCNLKRKRRSNATSATQSSALTADSLFPKPASSPSSFHNARHVQQNGGSYSDPQNDSLELHAHELVAIDPHPVIASVDSCPSSGQAADGVSPVSPQQRLKNPSHPPLVSHSVIRYLHRPLSSFSAALKWDPKYIAYAGHRLDPGHAPPQNVLHLVSEQLVEDLDEE